MKNKNFGNKIKKTMEFYDNYPLASSKFRNSTSVLKMEDTHMGFQELEDEIILDCGCGPGNISMKILKNVKNPDLISMDISIKSLNILKKRIKDCKIKSNNTLIQGDVLSIPFSQNSFDFIIASGVVHHTPDPFKSLDNLYEVLKENGKMYFSVYNKKSFYFPEFFTIGTLFRFFYHNRMKRLHKISISWFRIILSRINNQEILYSDAEKIFADRYLTPVASFHTYSQIKKWAKINNANIFKSGKCKLGTLIWFLVKKIA